MINSNTQKQMKKMNGYDQEALTALYSSLASRKECRAAAVKVLKEMKEQGSYESYEWQERRLEREENAWKYI